MTADPAAEADQPVTIYTVGHSNQSLESFIALLQSQGIQSLVDVRSAPYSRYVPHFNRPELEEAVESRGIRYWYRGDELGGRPPGDEYYDEHDHVLYSRVATAPFFLRGLERLTDEGATYRTAIMCSEEDPTDCHRRLLIARVLEQQGVRVLHIRAGNRAQTDHDLAPKVSEQLALFPTPESDQSEETEWKSIRPVSRRRPPNSSSNHSGEWGSDDF